MTRAELVIARALMRCRKALAEHDPSAAAPQLTIHLAADYPRSHQLGTAIVVTDACVLIVPCCCGAEVGKPCVTRSGHAAASTHADRRDEARRWKKRWRKTWAELLEGAAVSVRLSLKLLEGLEAPPDGDE